MSELAEILGSSFQRAPWGWALLASVLVALIKGWPALKKIAAERETGLLAARGEDIEDMRTRIGDLEKRVDQANEAANVARDAANIIKLQMVSMQAAFELVAGELEKADPDNKVLKQARRLIAQAATSDMGVGVGMRKLAKIKGVGE